MKPLHLKIAGLNSFREEQEVDFVSLGETGVFGIFGPTGSGKSSVLDAVTLALYGKVERAKGGTQGIINQNEDKLYVYFSFQIGERKYSAERTYKRGNDGSINQYSCRLLEIAPGGDSSCLAEKKREMDDKVQEILGLTVDDFTRAVVLPQGKFQEFLTLQGTERRKMLQRIFALEKYGEQLVKRIREKVNKTQLELEMKKHELDMLGDASQAAIKKAQKDAQAKELKVKELEEKLTLFHKKWEEYKEIRQLSQELTEVNHGLSKLAQEEPLIKEKSDKLDLAQKAEYLRPYLKQVTDGKGALIVKEEKLKLLSQDLKELQNHCTQVEGDFTAWESKYQSDGKLLEGYLIKLEGALEDEKTRDGYSEQLFQLRTDYRKLEETLNTLKAEINKLQNLKKEKETEKGLLDEKLSEKEIIVAQGEEIEKQKEAWQNLSEVTSRRQELAKELIEKNEQLNLGKIQKKELLEEIQTYEKVLAQVQVKIEAIPRPELSLEEIYQEQTKLQSIVILIDAIRENEQKLLNIEQELSDNNNLFLREEKHFTRELGIFDDLKMAKTGLINGITQLEEQERVLERKNYALSLRETLVTGEPCPVCGSLEHIKLDSQTIQLDLLEEISNQLKGKKQELAVLEVQLDKQGKTLASTEAYLQVLKVKKAELAKELEDLNQKLQATRLKLPEPWVLKQTESLTLLVNAGAEKLQSKQKELDESQKIKGDLNKETEEIESKLNNLKQKLSAKDAEIQLMFNEQENSQRKMENLIAVEKEKREYFQTLAGNRSGEEVAKLYLLLKTSRLEMQELQKRKNKVLQELDNLNTSLVNREKVLQEKEQSLKILANDGKTYRKLCDDLTLKINQITKGQKALEAKTVVEAQLQVIVDNLNKFKDELAKSKKSLEEKNREFHITSQEVTNLQHGLEKFQEVLRGKMDEYQFISLGQLEDALCTEEERQELAKAIKQYNEAKLLTQERKNDLIKKLANRSLSEEQWKQFLEQKSQLEIEEKQEREESYRLKLELDNLKEKNVRWSELTKELKELTSLLDQLARLDKLFKGNTFVEFIAEEQLMHVAIDASNRLGELTNYRYALEVDSDGGFIIRDDANGGLKRPVTTLSGGETFLTSLALALALSSQIQLRGKYPLEFFFLDEGFGTLDNHLLETVMNSLERLHLEKMTIGIISHVPELQARIPRSLIVDPAEKGGRGTHLRMEMQ